MSAPGNAPCTVYCQEEQIDTTTAIKETANAG